MKDEDFGLRCVDGQAVLGAVRRKIIQRRLKVLCGIRKETSVVSIEEGREGDIATGNNNGRDWKSIGQI